MANNCHFYICGICPRSEAQELEEDLNNQENFSRMWHLIVKPFERLCTIKEGVDKSSNLWGFEDAVEETPDEDLVLFVAEGWKAWNINLHNFVPGDNIFYFIQIEGDKDFYTGYGENEYYSADGNFQLDDGEYTCVDETTGFFGFPHVDDILSDLAPEHEKPRFKFLSEEELTDAYSNILYIDSDTNLAEEPEDDDEEETESDDTPPSPPPTPTTPSTSNTLSDMNADLKAALAKSQADLKKSLEDTMAETRKALNDSLKDAFKGL